MNTDLSKLQPYPFERIAALTAGIQPVEDKLLISFAMGEPKHPCPELITSALVEHLGLLEAYPLTKGNPLLRETIANWLIKRFHLPTTSIDPEQHILPVNGTREALFAFAQVIVERKKDAIVLMPNPFYQIYEGAALLAGAEPVFLPCTKATGFLPDFDAVSTAAWDACQLIYVCSPSNPTGAVMSFEQIKQLLELAEKHDFVIASDECYSELYLDEGQPPVGLLEVAAACGNSDYKRCIVFHSLSKRSNAPGLRSGFIAGDADIVKQFLLYRTYHGSAMSGMVQMASIAAWSDETHVRENRDLYRQKFDAVLDILSPVMAVEKPAASFYLWPESPIDDEIFTRDIYQQQHLKVIPGSYLSREVEGLNPGDQRIRLALVAPVDECIQGARRIKQFIEDL
jgi:N-succinyldiaminopimelate aminotransferase